MKLDEIKDLVEQYIIDTSLNAGDRLPSEQTIADELNLTRHQLRKAIEAFKNEQKLSQIRGSGTYLRPEMGKRKEKEKEIVLFLPLDPIFASVYDEFQKTVFLRGYQLNLVNSSQDPDFEKLYMEYLYKRRVSGVIISPSPVYEGIFQDIDMLRNDGVKVAVLNAPQKLLESKTGANFIFDFYTAGYQAVIHLLSSGYKKQVMISSLKSMPNAWHYKAHLEGAQKAAEEFDVELEVSYKHAQFNEFNELYWTEKQVSPLPLREDTGYICGNYRAMHLVNQNLIANKIQNYSIFSSSNKKVPFEFPYFYFDVAKQLHMAFEYLLDSKISSKKYYSNIIKPELVKTNEDENINEQETA
jgi:hypothetical protein